MKKIRCDACGERFGLTRQRWLVYQFCCNACMEDWLARRQREIESFKRRVYGSPVRDEAQMNALKASSPFDGRPAAAR
jgi:hypothetical protein